MLFRKKRVGRGKGQYMRWCNMYETHQSNNCRMYVASTTLYRANPWRGQVLPVGLQPVREGGFVCSNLATTCPLAIALSLLLVLIGGPINSGGKD